MFSVCVCRCRGRKDGTVNRRLFQEWELHTNADFRLQHLKRTAQNEDSWIFAPLVIGQSLPKKETEKLLGPLLEPGRKKKIKRNSPVFST